MKTFAVLSPLALFAIASPAEVRVTVEDLDGQASIHYACTAGEVVRAFALDVSVDRGQIVAISDFFCGVSQIGARGYGIFPASFRDHLMVSAGTNVNWDANGYTPLAAPADSAADTLPGLHSPGVTLEFAALWEPNEPATIPPPVGALCRLHLSEAANVLVTANISRGGVVAASTDATVLPVFAGGWVGPALEPAIRISVAGERVTLDFEGGELETATSVAGPWTGTGDTSGQFMDVVEPEATKFYRVHRH